MKFYDMEKFRSRPEATNQVSDPQFSPLWFIVDFGKSKDNANQEYNELNIRLSAIYDQVRCALPISMSRVLDEMGWIQMEKKLRLVQAAYQLGFARGCNAVRPGIRRKSYN